jgi:hypothetical protein
MKKIDGMVTALKGTCINDWNAAQLSAFCTIALSMMRKQYQMRIDSIPGLSEEQRALIHEEILKESEDVISNLIIMGLEYHHLKIENLKSTGSETKKVKRGLFLEETSDVGGTEG